MKGEKRIRLEDEENVRLYNHHRHHVPGGYQTPEAPLYAYDSEIGQTSLSFVKKIHRIVFL